MNLRLETQQRHQSGICRRKNIFFYAHAPCFPPFPRLHPCSLSSPPRFRPTSRPPTLPTPPPPRPAPRLVPSTTSHSSSATSSPLVRMLNQLNSSRLMSPFPSRSHKSKMSDSASLKRRRSQDCSFLFRTTAYVHKKNVHQIRRGPPPSPSSVLKTRTPPVPTHADTCFDPKALRTVHMNSLEDNKHTSTLWQVGVCNCLVSSTWR